MRRTRSWMSLRISGSNVRIVPSSRDFVRDDVRPVAALDDPDRQDRRRRREVRLAADDRLQAEDDLRRDDDRIDPVPRHGAVRLPPAHGDAQRVARRPSRRRHGRRGCPTRTGRRAARRPPRPSGCRARLRPPSASPPLFSPPSPSSAGWKRKTTVPGRSGFIPASTSAAPMRMAVCASWPHACITPTSRPLNCAFTVDLKGTSSSSVTGSASMSARSATTGPGFPPRRTPTTPVRATPVRTSRPSARRWSATMLRGAHLAVAELRVLVEVAPPGDRVWARAGRPPDRSDRAETLRAWRPGPAPRAARMRPWPRTAPARRPAG